MTDDGRGGNMKVKRHQHFFPLKLNSTFTCTMSLRLGSCVAYIYKTVAEREKWPKVPPAQENAEKR